MDDFTKSRGANLERSDKSEARDLKTPLQTFDIMKFIPTRTCRKRSTF